MRDTLLAVRGNGMSPAVLPLIAVAAVALAGVGVAAEDACSTLNPDNCICFDRFPYDDDNVLHPVSRSSGCAAATTCDACDKPLAICRQHLCQCVGGSANDSTLEGTEGDTLTAANDRGEAESATAFFQGCSLSLLSQSDKEGDRGMILISGTTTSVRMVDPVYLAQCSAAFVDCLTSTAVSIRDAAPFANPVEANDGASGDRVAGAQDLSDADRTAAPGHRTASPLLSDPSGWLATPSCVAWADTLCSEHQAVLDGDKLWWESTMLRDCYAMGCAVFSDYVAAVDSQHREEGVSMVRREPGLPAAPEAGIRSGHLVHPKTAQASGWRRVAAATRELASYPYTDALSALHNRSPVGLPMGTKIPVVTQLGQLQAPASATLVSYPFVDSQRFAACPSPVSSVWVVTLRGPQVRFLAVAPSLYQRELREALRADIAYHIQSVIPMYIELSRVALHQGAENLPVRSSNPLDVRSRTAAAMEEAGGDGDRVQVSFDSVDVQSVQYTHRQQMAVAVAFPVKADTDIDATLHLCLLQLGSKDCASIMTRELANGGRRGDQGDDQIHAMSPDYFNHTAKLLSRLSGTSFEHIAMNRVGVAREEVPWEGTGGLFCGSTGECVIGLLILIYAAALTITAVVMYVASRFQQPFNEEQYSEMWRRLHRMQQWVFKKRQRSK